MKNKKTKMDEPNPLQAVEMPEHVPGVTAEYKDEMIEPKPTNPEPTEPTKPTEPSTPKMVELVLTAHVGYLGAGSVIRVNEAEAERYINMGKARRK